MKALLQAANQAQQINRLLPKAKPPPLPPLREPKVPSPSATRVAFWVTVQFVCFALFYLALLLAGLLWLVLSVAWRFATGCWPQIEVTFPRRDPSQPPPFTGEAPVIPLTSGQRAKRDKKLRVTGPAKPAAKKHRIGGREVIGRSYTMDEILDLYGHEEPF